MKNDHFGIYVVLGKRTVEVINHVYNYTVPLDEETWKDVIDEFNKELEERRITMEKEISANIKYSLKNVIKGMEVKDEHK
jgi:predicted RND superfamily exporter protein